MSKHVIYPITNDYHIGSLISLSGYEREFRFLYENTWHKTLKKKNKFAFILYKANLEPRYKDWPIQNTLKNCLNSQHYYDSIYEPVSYVVAALKPDQPYRNCLFLCSLATHPSYRNLGYAKTLLTHLINFAKRPVITIIPDTYTDVCHLLSNLNFTVAGEFAFNGQQDLDSGYLFSLPDYALVNTVNK